MIRDYEHLPLGIYYKILAMRDDIDNSPAIVALLAGKTEDEVMRMPLAEYAILRDYAAFLFHTPKAARVRPSYTCGAFTLKPSDLEHLTTAQYIDFKEWARMDGDHTVELLSVLLVPRGKTYGEGYDVADVIEAIRGDMCVTDAAALRGFFVSRLARLTRVSLTFSAKIARRLKDQQTRTEMMDRIAGLYSCINGDGLDRSTRWQSLPAALGPRSME